MTDARPFNASHSAFNDMLTNSIHQGQSLLNRHHINDDYDESGRKDLNPNVSQSFSGKKSKVGQERYGESRYRPASKSPLKDYINSKIDSHIEKLKGSSVAGKTADDQTAQPEKSQYDNMMFESVVESNVNPYADEEPAQDEPKGNVNFRADHDSSANHQVIKISGNYDWDQKAPKRSQVDDLSRSHERHRPTLDKVSIHHHDSPTRASRVIDRTHHEVHQGEQLASSSLRKSQNLAGDAQEGHPDEDHWVSASRSIDRLHQKHSELEQSRIRQGAATADEIARAKAEEDSTQNKSYRYATETQYSSPHKRLEDTLRLRALEDMSPAHVEAHETSVNQSNGQLVNRYHAMKQHGAKISRQTLKFAGTRINPPRCLLDALDALFSLIYGVYGKVEHDYFSAKEKKYFEFKVYFQSLDELSEVLNHLKLYVETQGLPIRNIMAADQALCRYNKTVKRIEAKPYLETTEEIAKFVLFFLEYYNILRKLNLEPLSKKDAERGTVTTSPQYLKNATHKDWHENIYEAPPSHHEFSEEELVGLLQTTVKRKTWVIIKGLERPPDSILYGVKGVYYLLQPFIKQPLISTKREWEFFQGQLKKTIPDLVDDLPNLLKEDRIPEKNVRAAEGFITQFKDLVMSRREVNDSFTMQYATKIIDFLHYAVKLYNLYHSSD